MSDFPGKTSKRRPLQTSREENNLRWALYQGRIKFTEFERKYKELLKQGKIVRNGKVIKHD